MVALLHALAALLAGTTVAAPRPDGSALDKRTDSWGPAVYTGPAKYSIISAVTTTYPGKDPQKQTGYLFLWVGMSNGTGDLVQSIVGSYPAGQSECTGKGVDTNW